MAKTKTKSPTEIELIVQDKATTKSHKIRALLALNLKRRPIADLLGVRYQFVRNVEVAPLPKNPR